MVEPFEAERKEMNEKFSWGWYRLDETQITQTDRCMVLDRGLSTARCKQFVVEAFRDLENKTFDDICADINRRAVSEAKLEEWGQFIKVTFVCSIVTPDRYKLEES